MLCCCKFPTFPAGRWLISVSQSAWFLLGPNSVPLEVGNVDGEELSQRAWQAQSVLRKHMAGRYSKCSKLLFLLHLVCEESEFSPVRKAALSTGFVGSFTPGSWTCVRDEMESAAAPLGPGQGCYCCFLWLM